MTDATSSLPEVFSPGLISTADEEYRISFTPDGKTAYFSRSEAFFPQSRQAWIYEVRQVDGAWAEPEVASFSGKFSDIDPVVSPDGRRLYFSSIRPVDGTTRTDADVWVTEWGADGWGEPRNLGEVVNSEYDELYPSVDAVGNLYVGSSRPHREGSPRKWNIWHFEPLADGYERGVLLTQDINAGNETIWNFNPAISPNGNFLLFTRLNLADPENTGLGELFVSARAPEGWSPPRNLGAPVNSPLDEFHGSFSPDGTTLYFVRRDAGAASPNGDLYRARVADLPELLRSAGRPPS